MKPYYILQPTECLRILQKIVSEFGEGDLIYNEYVFDLITRLPAGFSETKISSNKIQFSFARHPDICIIFDPKNRIYTNQLLRDRCIDEDAQGLKIVLDDLSQFISAPDCDLYITSMDGQLLGACSHEDVWIGSERLIWCPIQNIDAK